MCSRGQLYFQTIDPFTLNDQNLCAAYQSLSLRHVLERPVSKVTYIRFDTN